MKWTSSAISLKFQLETQTGRPNWFGLAPKLSKQLPNPWVISQEGSGGCLILSYPEVIADDFRGFELGVNMCEPAKTNVRVPNCTIGDPAIFFKPTFGLYISILCAVLPICVFHFKIVYSLLLILWIKPSPRLMYRCCPNEICHPLLNLHV